MPYERTGYAPWSLTREAGVQSATVDGTIQVPQYIQPVLSTGFIDEAGNWKGTRSSDEVFKKLAKETAVPNGQEILAPGGDEPYIDMTGYRDLFMAIKPTEGGGSGFAIVAIMGTDTQPFANLTPVAAAATLRGNQSQSAPGDFENIFNETAQTMFQNVWNIFSINDVLRNQKNLQFKITNNTGATTDIEYGFMRIV
jgi:hypothetical protein